MIAEVGALGADELTCRPGSVLARLAASAMGDHPSGTAVTNGLVRSTRELGGPPSNARADVVPPEGCGVLLILLQVGFT